MKTFVLKIFEEAEKEGHPDWKDELAKCKHLFETSALPDHEELTFMAKVFKVRLEVSYSTSASPVQGVGPVDASKLYLSNEPCVDGAGQSAAHFRFIWKCNENEKAEPGKEPQPRRANSTGVGLHIKNFIENNLHFTMFLGLQMDCRTNVTSCWQVCFTVGTWSQRCKKSFQISLLDQTWQLCQSGDTRQRGKSAQTCPVC